MAEKQRYELEFVINTTRRVLYQQIITPEGLAEWFADDVKTESDNYFFSWEGDEESAILIEQREEELVRFQWEEEKEEGTYFQFKINVDPVTNELALIITDFAEAEELEGAQYLWESQVEDLRHTIGA